jgi:hypothetical protein
MEKLTYVVALNTAIATLSADPEMTAVVEKLTALRDAQVKRNSAERKPTKTQVANLDLMAEVKAVLANASAPLTITEIMGRSEVLAPLSNQKVSALVRGLGAEVVKITDKRVSKFTLA